MNVFRNGASCLLLALTCHSAHAADFCVNTSAQLQQAFTTAGTNGEADRIRIEIGTYAGSSGNVAFAFYSSENFSLQVSGGWISNPPSMMCFENSNQPDLTVLTGSDERQVLKLDGAAGTSGALSLSTLTIRDGFTSQAGAGLAIGGGGFSGSVVVNHVVIQRNVSTMVGGGMRLFSEGIVSVRNNLFLLNRCAFSNCAIIATVNAADSSTTRAFFGNNTIVGNQCTSGSTCTDTGARFGGSARAVFYNNVFAANSNGDLNLFSFSGGSVDLYNNSIVSITGTAPTVMSGNIAFANPQFVDLLNDDLRPTLTSPLRNAGTDLFALQSLDLAGVARVNESIVDIGAYENNDLIFANQFDLVQ